MLFTNAQLQPICSRSKVGVHKRRSLGPLLVGAAVAVLTLQGVARGQNQLSPSPALYARTVQVAHAQNGGDNGQVIATVNSFANGSRVDVYASGDGSGFTQVGTITDGDFSSGLCCGTLFELPQSVGGIPAGTLLWAGSVGQNAQDRRMQIKVYRSDDEGRNWYYLSGFSSPNTGGLWEPQFTIADDGGLVIFYSDETDPAHSQRIVQARSYDGYNWQDFRNVVSSTVQNDRPGMAVVNRLANGSRFMTFELCGPAACTVFWKTSGNGWDWGDPGNVGSAIRLPDGRFFEHAPTNTVLPDGSILVIGQVLLNGDGSVAAGNGSTIFKHSGDPGQDWYAIGAPVSVPGAYDNYCPNYASPLLSLNGGSSVLEFADRGSNGDCYMFYNTGPSS